MCWPEFQITKHAGFAYKNADQRHETLTEGKTESLEEVFAIAVFTWLSLTFFFCTQELHTQSNPLLSVSSQGTGVS